MKKDTIRIVYEDDFLMVVHKPSGLLVMPADSGSKKDLRLLLNEMVKKSCVSASVYPCHRLDKETSGLIIFAKSKKIQELMMLKFRLRQIEKIYIAFVQGEIKKKQGELKSYIKRAWPYETKGKSKIAITKFQTIYHCPQFSVLKIALITGRTNQIRIQFKDIKHPLIGDRRFAFAKDWPIKFKRTALHSFLLEFTHPVKNCRVCLKSPLPFDLRKFLLQYGVESLEFAD
ncbi:MAG: hypothetical protein DRP78_06315 [Candidatus Omnitrophota bacterium]|nr:MAG: hypothetical protein DRP78_06315 [Candidatus Omnitrophota bacterium]